MWSFAKFSRQRLITWLIPLGLMALFVLYQSWPIFTEPQFYSDDQLSNWLLALRQADPAFLSHDYAFGNPLFQGHYIPVYLFGLHTLGYYLGGLDPAMIFLHTVILSGYLASMFVLLRFVTGNNLVAAFVAVVSALARGSIAQEVWAATDMRAVMPRNAFLVTVPLLTLLLFRWLPGEKWWRIPLLGLFIGLATNLHPPSGLFFLQIAATLILIFSSVPLRERVGGLLLAGLGFGLGGLPTVWAVIRGVWQARQLTPDGSFQEFAEIMHWRMRTEFPFPPEQIKFIGESFSADRQSFLVVLYLVGMGLWLGVAWWLRRGTSPPGKIHSRSWIWMLVWLLALNIPLAYLTSTFLALDLILVAAAYWITRLIRQDYDSYDLWSLAILVCAGAYSFGGSAVLGWIWETFEVWSLSSFFGEQARMSRFIYLPLFIFLARWLALLGSQRQDRVLAGTIIVGLIGGLAVRHWHFLDPWGSAEWGMAASLGVLAAAGVWLCVRPAVSLPASAVALAIGLAAAAYLWFYIVGVNFPWLGGLALGAGGMAALARAGWSRPVWRGATTAGLILLVGFGLFWGPALATSEGQRAPLRTQAMKALGLYEYGIPSDWPDSLALYEWARHQTDEDALFYFNDRQYEFRAFGRRAVTHSWKDVGGGYYTPPLAIDYYRRFQTLDSAYENPPQLLACAQVYRADYIIVKEAQPVLDLPVAYGNNLYTVYTVPETGEVDPALCQ